MRRAEVSLSRLKKIRFYYQDDMVVTSLNRIATENNTDYKGAVELMGKWLEDGDLVRRADGGFDVINFRPPVGKPLVAPAPTRKRNA